MYNSMSQGSLRGRVLLGLFGSLLSASAGAFVGQYVPPALYMPIWLAMIIMVIVASFVRRRPVSWTFVTIFTLLSGMTLTPILMMYTQMIGVRMVEEALLVTTGAFGVTAFIASRKNADFSFLRSFLSVGLFVLIGLMIVNMIFPMGSAMTLGYTYLGIAVFVGYMLFDVNRLTRYGAMPEQIPGIVLSLYLDFINLFLFILQLFGLNVRSRN
ncbi:MAG: Bax inhibitor-1/YccA family protein [Firmicutes bacterium]|nr:Bax inhibitor-1/YccA family protein [Bacillota bacterium]